MPRRPTAEDCTATTANAPTHSLTNQQSHSPCDGGGFKMDFKSNLLMQPRTDIASNAEWANASEPQALEAG